MATWLVSGSHLCKPNTFFNPDLQDTGCYVEEETAKPFPELDFYIQSALETSEQERAQFLQDRCDIWLTKIGQEEHGKLYRETAELAESKGYFKESSVYFRKAAEWAYNNYDEQEAIRCYCNSFELSATTAEVWLKNSLCIYGQTGDFDLCLALLDKGIKLFPESRNLIFHAINIAQQAENREQVENYIRMLSDENLKIFYENELRQVEDILGTLPGEARKKCRVLLDLFGLASLKFRAKSSDLHYRIFMVNIRCENALRKDITLIRACYQAALDALPQDQKWKVLLQLGKFEARNNNYDKAIKAFSEAFDLCPSLEGKYQLLKEWALSARKKGSLEVMLACFEKGVQIAKGSASEIYFLRRRSEIEKQLGQVIAAANSLRRIHRLEREQSRPILGSNTTQGRTKTPSPPAGAA